MEAGAVGRGPGLGFQSHPQVHAPLLLVGQLPLGAWPRADLDDAHRLPFLLRRRAMPGCHFFFYLQTAWVWFNAASSSSTRLKYITVYLVAHQARRPLLNSSVVPRSWGVRSPQISPHCFGEDSSAGPRAPPTLTAWSGHRCLEGHQRCPRGWTPEPPPPKAGGRRSPGERGSREPILFQHGCRLPPTPPRPGAQDSALALECTETWVWAGLSFLICKVELMTSPWLASGRLGGPLKRSSNSAGQSHSSSAADQAPAPHQRLQLDQEAPLSAPGEVFPASSSPHLNTPSTPHRALI